MNKIFKNYFYKGITAFGVIAAGISFFFILYKWNDIVAAFDNLGKILAPITIGFVLAYLLNPIMMFFEKYVFKKYLPKIKIIKKEKAGSLARGFSIAFALIVATIFIYVFFSVIIPEITESIKTLIYNMPKYGRNVIQYINNFLEKNPSISEMLEKSFKTDISTIIENILQSIVTWAKDNFLSKSDVLAGYFASGFIGIYNVIKNLIIGIIVSVYVLYSKEIFTGQAKKLTYCILNEKKANILLKTMRKSNVIFSGFIYGKIVDSAIIGVICFVSMLVMKMPYYLLVSFIVGVTNIIPFFGPYIGAIPCSILILIVDPLKGLYFIIFIIILQQIDGNIIGPKILGDSTGLSAFWVLFSILTFGGLFGFIGMVIGVPTFAVIYYILQEIITYLLKKKNLPLNSKDYLNIDKIEYINQKNKISYREIHEKKD